MSGKSLTIRVTIPKGLPITDHLEQLPTNKARSHELLRLAELMFMVQHAPHNPFSEQVGISPRTNEKNVSSPNESPHQENEGFGEQQKNSELSSTSDGVDFRGALDDYIG